MSKIGIRESIYNQLRAEGYSPLGALAMVDSRLDYLLKELRNS